MTSIAFVTAGVVMIVLVWLSVLRTVFIPRETSSRLARWLPRVLVRVAGAVAHRLSARAAGLLLDFCAPLSLFGIAVVWLLGIALGCVLVGVGAGMFSRPPSAGPRSMGPSVGGLVVAGTVSAALVLAAFSAYLARFVDAYRRRERQLARLSLGLPHLSRSDRLLIACLRATSPKQLDDAFAEWADWLVDIHTTHLDCPALLYARPSGTLSWPTAAVMLLDTAAVVEAVAPSRSTVHARRLLASGSTCVRRIADRAGIELPAAAVSLQGREEARFHDTVRHVVDAGFSPERDLHEMWTAFQRERTGYAPYATAITFHLMYDIDAPADAR